MGRTTYRSKRWPVEGRWVALGVTALLAGGCGVKWEALPEGRQVAILDDKGIVEEQGGVIVAARPVRVSFADNDEVLAFTVEITNRRETPIEIRLDQFTLRDEQGRLRRPMEEETLKQRFDVGDDETYADARGLSGLAMADVGWGGVTFARFRLHRHRYHRHRYGCYGYYRPYVSYYWYWGPYWYPSYEYWYYNDVAQVAADRRRVARFLSEIWHEATLGPDEVGTGNILFAHPTRKGDEVTLLFRPEIPAEPDQKSQTQPAGEFAFRFFRKR